MPLAPPVSPREDSGYKTPAKEEKEDDDEAAISAAMREEKEEIIFLLLLILVMLQRGYGQSVHAIDAYGQSVHEGVVLLLHLRRRGGEIHLLLLVLSVEEEKERN